MAASEFSTYNNGLFPTKYEENANLLLEEVTDETIHLDLINRTKANGTLYNHTIFGNIGSRNINIFYFINRTKPNVIV